MLKIILKKEGISSKYVESGIGLLNRDRDTINRAGSGY